MKMHTVKLGDVGFGSAQPTGLRITQPNMTTNRSLSEVEGNETAAAILAKFKGMLK